MKKRYPALMLALALCLGLAPAQAASAPGTTVVLKIGCNRMAVNGKIGPVDTASSEVTPIAENNRTLVPVSRIVDAFGGKSTWEAATNLTTYTLGGKTATHVIGSRNIEVGEDLIRMDVSSKAMNNRTYMPLRFLLEGLGLWVDYEPTYQLVVVSTRDLAGKDLTALDASKALLSDLGITLEAPKPPAPTPTPAQSSGPKVAVPDLMTYFKLGKAQYAVDAIEGGRAYTALLERVFASDKALLDGFVEVLSKQKYHLTQVAMKEDWTPSYDWYSQDFYFRYEKSGVERLGVVDGKDYHIHLSYTNIYGENGTEEGACTRLTMELAEGLTATDSGDRDNLWHVTRLGGS